MSLKTKVELAWLLRSLRKQQAKFLKGSARNKWLRVRWGTETVLEVYVRKSVRLWLKPGDLAFDVANMQLHEELQNQGWLAPIMETLHDGHDLAGTYVENVSHRRMLAHCEGRPFYEEVDAGELHLCFFRRKT